MDSASPVCQLHITGNRIDLSVEDSFMEMFTRYKERVRFGSLMLSAQKNHVVTTFDLKFSFLWSIFQKIEGQPERIRDFEPFVYNSIRYHWGDYCLALYKFKSEHKLDLFPVPLPFYLNIFLYYLREDYLWLRSSNEISVLPIGQLMRSIQQDSNWMTHCLWNLLKGHSPVCYSENQISASLKPTFDIFQALIHEHIHPNLSIYQFFEPHFERFCKHNNESLSVCSNCVIWLQRETYSSWNSKQKMCFMCILRRHLTFGNIQEFLDFLTEVGVPTPFTERHFRALSESPVLLQRLSDILWKSFEKNQSDHITQIVKVCKLLYVEPSSLLFYNDHNHLMKHGYISKIDIFAKVSLGCTALFFSQCGLSNEEKIQALTDIAEFQLERTRLEKEMKINKVFSTATSSASAIIRSSIRRSETSGNNEIYPFFPDSFLFPREAIAIPPL